MRSYVLTDRERAIINEYIETGKRLDGFRQLKSVLHSLDLQQVETDMKLIKTFKAKL